MGVQKESNLDQELGKRDNVRQLESGGPKLLQFPDGPVPVEVLFAVPGN
jgi:hypothetical protein